MRLYLEELVRKEKIKRSLEKAKKIRESLKDRSLVPSDKLVREERDEDYS